MVKKKVPTPQNGKSSKTKTKPTPKRPPPVPATPARFQKASASKRGGAKAKSPIRNKNFATELGGSNKASSASAPAPKASNVPSTKYTTRYGASSKPKAPSPSPKPSDARNNKCTARNDNSEKDNSASLAVPKSSLRSSVTMPTRSVLLVIYGLLSLELLLDLATTIISFVAFVAEGSCCGRKIDFGNLTLGITIPYFILIVTELGFLSYSVRAFLTSSDKDVDVESQEKQDARSSGFAVLKMLQWLFLANPFFGFLVSFGLMYESSKNDSLIVLGLEGGSILLQWTAAYLEGDKTRCMILIHAIPLLPFVSTVIVIMVYLNNEGICYIGGNIRFTGCGVCADGFPEVDGCADGSVAVNGEYCAATVEETFCWFPY